jgi:hypothetical protein
LLSGIAQVAVRRKGLEKWLGIGDIVIWLDDPKEGEAILHALTNPRTAGDLIREAVHGAKENAVAAQDTDKTEIINTDL